MTQLELGKHVATPTHPVPRPDVNASYRSWVRMYDLRYQDSTETDESWVLLATYAPKHSKAW
jgi:hypothetical protein